MKRQESSSGKSLGLTSSSDAKPSKAAAAAAAAALDSNGKDKRHGGALGRLRIWLGRNGRSAVAALILLVASVYLIPPLTVLLGPPARPAPDSAGSAGSAGLAGSASAGLKGAATAAAAAIPDCPSAPWKEDEDLRGKCPGDLKPVAGPDAPETAAECASSCCDSAECVTWQFRQDTGCIQGKDVRIGQEKDGVSAWCSDHPPQKWQGQFLKAHGKTKGWDEAAIRKGGCSTETWDPREEPGQCFGLGDVRENASGSAEECMRACCDETRFVCGAWQWNAELGCFYGKGMHGCQGDDGDPVKFEPFVGRRKRMAGRTYTDKHNRPWNMEMPAAG
mmetsp:Transcript_22248/g.49471  ORF Transcript_22248/g.49471 Transcript_22248/m.49471 type:complete len:334 (-) Transcript_22248:175-1176(-)